MNEAEHVCALAELLHHVAHFLGNRLEVVTDVPGQQPPCVCRFNISVDHRVSEVRLVVPVDADETIRHPPMIGVVPVPSRTMDPKEILTVVRRDHPVRRVLAVGDELNARHDHVVVRHGVDREAAQTGDLAAIRLSQTVAHWYDRNTCPPTQRRSNPRRPTIAA